ncbi:hypothetical protein MMC07_000956 [Pseudocyphellaria aurata]|nr:hypothetical protein [Pseudocyphellaria aurata]
MDVGEDNTRNDPLIVYSATLGCQRAINEDDPYNVVYKARCVPAVYHDQIRKELIATAAEDGAYTSKPTEGTEALDITAFHREQIDWQERGAGRPDQLKHFAKPQDFANPQYNLGFMYFNGYLVIDHEGQPLRPFRGVPLTLSSKLEGWRAEAIRRSDPRIRSVDLIARMPVKVEPSANGKEIRNPLVKENAVAGRQNRFREQAGAITWVRPTAKNVHDFLWSRLPQNCKENNLALPRDLTKQEQWQLRALNVGKKPERARKIPTTDKGMTREQYVDRVQMRATQGEVPPRAANTRRRRKEVVRNARRESIVEGLPDVSTTREVRALSRLSDLVHVHGRCQPAPAAPAAPAVPAPFTAPRASTADALLLRSAIERARTALFQGHGDPPPVPFVRPGEYFYDEYKYFSR